MKKRKTLNANILKQEIEVYCATMANFWNYKNDVMYENSKQGIYTIIELMVYYMGYKREELIQFAKEKLCSFILNDANNATTTDDICKELE